MKNHFLIVFCLVFVVASFCNISAMYKGTLTVDVGSSVSVNIGNPPSFNVVNGTTQQTPTPVTTLSGGGGGGGGGTITSNSVTNPTTGASCTENWQCAAFGTCNNGIQTRTCTDTNNCGTTTNRPALSELCTTPSTSLFGITGGAIGAIGNFVKTGAGIATIIGLVVVIVLGISFIAVRKSKLAKKETKNE